jgi:hypothetical protein
MRPAFPVLALCAALATPAVSETRFNATFDLYALGVRGGSITLAAVQNAREYAVAAQAQASGPFRWFRRLDMEGRSRGAVRGDSLAPANFAGQISGGRRASVAEIAYTGNLPEVLRFEPAPDRPRPAPDPASLPGSLDPLTAIYEVLRNRSGADLCDLDIRVYDGQRLNRLRLSGRVEATDRVICSGEWLRLSGYRPQELERRTRFPLSISYQPSPEAGWQVDEVTVDNTFGRAVVRRR